MESDEPSAPVVTERGGQELSRASPAATGTHTHERSFTWNPSSHIAPCEQDSPPAEGTGHGEEYQVGLVRALTDIDAAADHARLDECARLVDRSAGRFIDADLVSLRAAVDARRSALDGGLSSLSLNILGQIRIACSAEALDAILGRISATRRNTTPDERDKLREAARQRRVEIGAVATG